MMLLSSIALLLSVILGAVCHGQNTSCEKPTSFYIPNTKTNWIGAVEYCNRINMRLAVVNSDAKSEAVLETIESAIANGLELTNVWLGASDIAKEGTFVWHATGLPVNYTNWSKNNPDNFECKENCMEIANKAYTQWTWAWNDIKCDTVSNFICEFNSLARYGTNDSFEEWGNQLEQLNL